MIRQSLKAAEARRDTPDGGEAYLERAARQLRPAG